MKRCHNLAAFVLAGGASTRMGRDKALLELDGVPMVVRMARLAEPHAASVAVVGPPERYAHLGAPQLDHGVDESGGARGRAAAEARQEC